MMIFLQAMHRRWSHVTFNYREGGFSQVLWKILLRLRGWLWSEETWFIYGVELATYSKTPTSELTHRVIGTEEMARIGYYRFVNFPDYVLARLDAGEECHAFYWRGEFANLHWLAHGYLPIEPGVCVRAPNCLGIFDAFTGFSFRGRGIHTDALIFAALTSQARGCHRAIGAVHPSNVVAIRCFERAGFLYNLRVTQRIHFGRSRVTHSHWAGHIKARDNAPSPDAIRFNEISL